MPSSWKSPHHKDFEFMEVRGFSAHKRPQSLSPPAVPVAPPGLPAPRRGRPAKGSVVEPVEVRAVKMPPAFWLALAAAARRRGLTLHGAMRTALVAWLDANPGRA
jgi:hypothetical protein